MPVCRVCYNLKALQRPFRREFIKADEKDPVPFRQVSMSVLTSVVVTTRSRSQQTSKISTEHELHPDSRIRDWRNRVCHLLHNCFKLPTTRFAEARNFIRHDLQHNLGFRIVDSDEDFRASAVPLRVRALKHPRQIHFPSVEGEKRAAGTDMDKTTDAGPRKRSHSVTRGNAGDDVDRKEQERDVPYEQTFEPKGDDVRSEFKEVNLNQRPGKTARSFSEAHRTVSSTDEVRAEAKAESFSQKEPPREQARNEQTPYEQIFEPKGDDVRSEFREGKAKQNHGKRKRSLSEDTNPVSSKTKAQAETCDTVTQDEEETGRRKLHHNRNVEPQPKTKAAFADIPAAEEIKRQSDMGPVPAPMYEASSSLPHTKQRPEPSAASKHTSKTVEFPTNEQMKGQAAQTGARSSGKSNTTSPALKRGASDPIPSSPPKTKRARPAFRSATVPEPNSSAAIPEFIPIYEQMLRNATGAATQNSQSPKPVPVSASSGPKKRNFPPMPSSPPKIRRSNPTPKHVTAQSALDKYIKTWNNLARHEQGWPYPNPELTESGLLNKSSIDSTAEDLSKFSETAIISLNTQSFFLKGHDITFTLITSDTEARFVVSSIRNGVEQLKALRAYLKKKELARWHPDRLNLRTGHEGEEPDERIGSLAVVAAVRTGIDQLVERCEEAVKAAEKNGCGR